MRFSFLVFLTANLCALGLCFSSCCSNSEDANEDHNLGGEEEENGSETLGTLALTTRQELCEHYVNEVVAPHDEDLLRIQCKTNAAVKALDTGSINLCYFSEEACVNDGRTVSAYEDRFGRYDDCANMTEGDPLPLEEPGFDCNDASLSSYRACIAHLKEIFSSLIREIKEIDACSLASSDDNATQLMSYDTQVESRKAQLDENSFLRFSSPDDACGQLRAQCIEL